MEEIEEIRERLRSGQLVSDHAFDFWLPDLARRHSIRHWTQVGVAARVAGWLAARGVSRVLDIGSGIGKFCVVGALSSDLAFVGVEHRRSLVETARCVAAMFDVEKRATFLHGDATEVEASAFDALYLYNPFEENLHPASVWIDQTVEVSRRRFTQSLSRVERLLSDRPSGSYVVTYNSFGGRIPDSYDLELSKVAGTNLLRLWRKTRDVDRGGCWLELEEATVLKTPEWCKRSAKGRKRDRESGREVQHGAGDEGHAHLQLVHALEKKE